MRFRRKLSARVDDQIDRDREDRLVDAEKRVNVLLRTADLIHSAVAKRDAENGWQASVNQMFLGGNP